MSMSMLRDIGESIGSAVLDGIGRASSKVQERKPLPVDLLESDEAYLAVFDAAGASAADVQVRFEHNVLRVQVDRFREFYDEFEMRLPGRGMALDGRVDLPEDAEVDPRRATATVTSNGTLQVELPKVDHGDEAPVEVETTDVQAEPEDGEDEADDEPTVATDDSTSTDSTTDVDEIDEVDGPADDDESRA